MDKKLVGFITSSLPENNFTIDLALSMKDAGVDILELGIPFSDPVADGPIIEKASLTALNNGFKLKDLFEISAQIAPQMDTLWMGYMNPFYHYGMEDFLKKAKEFNIQGLIIPDLPYEEAKVYKDIFAKYDQSLIDFVAPTDSFERIKTITQRSNKFIYMVAYTGITGSGVTEDLQPFLSSIKRYTTTPVYVGFGVNAKTAKDKVKGSDGVIVGSAFIDILLREELSYSQKIAQCSELSKIIKNEINI